VKFDFTPIQYERRMYMSYRIAIATGDGVTSDQHFGQAKEFHVFAVDDSKYEWIGARRVAPVCGNCGQAHEDKDFDSIAELLRDCDTIAVSKIGPGAVRYLRGENFRVFEAHGEIKNILDMIIQKNLMANE
jgi:predicted Fe-Mo cluster-binding NifX family protein